MSVPPGRGKGPVGVVSAVSGAAESAVAVALSGRRDLVLVRRCADVAELLSVAEVGLASVAVLSEAFTGMDADVVDRLRRAGLAVLGVVDPHRESSERLRAWGVPVVEVVTGTGPADDVDSRLATAVVAAAGARPGATGGTDGARGGPDGRRGDAAGPGTPGPPGPSRGPAAGAGGGRGGSGARRSGAAAGSGAHGSTGRDGDAGADTSAGPGGPGGPGAGTGPGGPAGPAGGAAGAGPAGADEPSTGSVAGPGRRLPGGDGPEDDDLAAAVTTARGRVVAVWGAAGAPGRTTVAVGVAAELADAGQEVLLVDADTYAASVAQVLGLLDESPGLVAAVRAGLDGRLDPAALARLAPVASPGLRVLTGLTRAARWSELRPAGLQAVLAAGRALADVVVVDLAPPLEEDEELSYDTAAPRRNGAALDVLRAADEVLVVGSADPVGLQRLVRALQDLATVLPGAAPVVVVTKLRADAVGRNPTLRVREALERFAGTEVRHLVPDDRAAADRALLAGRTLLEQAPDSPARAALRTLAASLLPDPAGRAQQPRHGGRGRPGRGARRRAASG